MATTTSPKKCLFEAAELGDVDELQRAFKEGVLVNAKDGSNFNMTALHYAARNGHGHVAELLVQNGADVNAKECLFGCTALHEAAFNGHIGVAQVLINQGAADPNKADDEFGYTALHYAAGEGHEDLVELLIEKGANVDSKDTDGCTALHFAPSSRVAMLLIETGRSDINSKDNDNSTALHSAAINGREDVAALLIEKGADISCKDNDGKTALNYAEIDGKSGLIALFIGITNTDVDDCTAEKEITTTSTTNNQQIRAADVEGKSSRTATTHQIAEHRESKATNNESSSSINALLPDDGDDQPSAGLTALHLAARNGHTDVAELLLRKGARVNCKDQQGKTALHYACERGHKDLAELLLDRGADVNSKAKPTAMHLAYLANNNSDCEQCCQIWL